VGLPAAIISMSQKKITLLFATHNRHKAVEVSTILKDRFVIIDLKQAGITQSIPEPYDTLEKNASAKSAAIFALTGENCFSEDSGLEVKALKGAPGVHSARYAGDDATAEENISKLLHELTNVDDRRARFRTVISLILNNKEFQFEGICEGRITVQPQGDSGFGYDPVFVPDGSEKTFALMTMEEKNVFSHRKKAMEKLANFLETL